MWGLYGNCGNGVSFQYDVKKLDDWFSKQSLHDYHYMCGGVLYDNDDMKNKYSDFKQITKKRLKVLADGVINKWNNKEVYLDTVTNAVNKSGLTEEHLNFIFTKSTEWAHEKEWRFIWSRRGIRYDFGNVRQPSGSYKNINNNIREYYYTQDGHINHKKMKFDFIKPSRIVFGWNVDLEDTNNIYYKLHEWIKKQGDIEIVYLQKSLNYNTYEFNHTKHLTNLNSI